MNHFSKLVLLTVIFNLNGMQQTRGKARPSKASISANPETLPALSATLLAAIRDNNLEKTRNAIKKIHELNKPATDLQCLEIEASGLIEALKFHYAAKSKEVAKITARTEADKHTISELAPNAFQAAIIDHGNSLAIYNIVLNFFIEHTREEPASCALNLMGNIRPPS